MSEARLLRSPCRHRGPGQAPSSPSSPAAGSSLLPIDLPATGKGHSKPFPLLPPLARNLRQLQRCSETHRTGAQLPASPFALKMGNKNVKLPNPKTFLPLHFQVRRTRS